jgi:hypothetical protein
VRLRRLLIALAAWAAGAAVFFHAELLSGFRWLRGDVGDVRLGVFLVEHWRHVLAGGSMAGTGWLTPPYFHPVPRTLAYTDATFGMALPHAVLRWLGLDELLAFELVVILLSLVGVFGFVALARLLRVPFAIALPAALGFTFANMNYAKASHPVYALIWLLPVLALCWVRALMALARGLAPAVAWGVAGAALLGFIAFTTFQIAWYPVFVAGVAGAALLALERARLRAAIAAVGVARLSAFGAIVAAALVVAFVPFAITYGPELIGGAERPFWAVLIFAPRPRALVDFGGDNLMWSWITRALDETRTTAYMNSEHSLAQTPIVTALFTIVTLRLWLRRRDGRLDTREALLLAGAIAVIVIVPFAFKIGNVSLWYLIWAVVPGARAIRTPFRVQLVLGLLTWLMLAYGATRLHARLAATRARGVATAAVAALAALVLVEQVNLTPVAQIDRPAELARLAAVPPPPAPCRAFYVRSQEPRHLGLQADAMMVTARFGIPTINGLSGATPPDWAPGIAHVDGPGYEPAVAAWAATHGIAAGLCALELPAGRWIPPGS